MLVATEPDSRVGDSMVAGLGPSKAGAGLGAGLDATNAKAGARLGARAGPGAGLGAMAEGLPTRPASALGLRKTPFLWSEPTSQAVSTVCVQRDYYLWLNPLRMLSRLPSG